MAKIRQSNLDNSIITGNTELAESAAANDILLIYDTTAGVIKKVLSSNVGVQGVTLTSISPTNVVSGDGTGNHTFTLTGTNFTGAAATLINNSGTAVAFDSVTINSATQITGVIAKSSLTNAGEPYDVKVTGANNITAQLDNQINIDASPVFVTDAGSLGDVIATTAGSFSVNATDPESAGNVTFELQSGSLPPSYTITNTAAEGGTAIIAGTDSTTSSTTTFNFVLRAVDAASNTTSRAFSITSRIPVSESFTSSGTFSVPAGITAADVLVVAGGGSGGSVYTSGAGAGAGAGGLIFFPAYPLTASGTITVTVGCGGAGAPSAGDSAGTNGQNSVFGSPGDPGLGQGGILTTLGGGYGGPTSGNGGGSGAGGANSGSAHDGATAQQPTQPGNSGAYGFGSPGGNAGGPGPYGNGSAGGGGGAGSAGAGGRGGQGGAPNGGNGGAGKAYTIADGTTPVYYAGGGGGGSGQTPGEAREGVGGQGGGTPGSSPDPSTHPGTPGAGTANRGGGSGGANSGQGTGAGGKGVVIVRY